VKDRLVAGGLAGMIAGFIQYAYGLITEAIGITDRAFGQFSEIVLSSRIYTGVLGFVIGLLAHLAVTIMFGVLFAYLIEKSSSRYYLLKGAGYGLVLWFLLSGFGTVARLPLFEDIPPLAALDILIGSLLYGVTLGYVLKIIDKKSNLL
jgi:uncharacterized membrane protein YagU involved in acid resistance